MRIRHITVGAALLLIWGSWSVALGQPGSGGPGTKKPIPKFTSKVKTVFKTVRLITPTTGSLAVSADSNANLLVEPLTNKRAEGQEGTVPDGERIFIFNDLKPGRYRVAGALDKHHPQEKVVEIRANKNQSVTLDFVPIVFSVTIKTNVGTGDVRYGPEGEPLNHVASIINGKTQLSLMEGRYTVAIATGEFGYETRRETFLVNKDQVVDLPLNTIILSTDSFSANWTKSGLQDWEMPAGWLDVKKTLVVKGAGVALPRQRGYRFYKDFKLTSNAMMSNGVAISFALRARDSHNYYLVQLTGTKSDDPHMLRLYKVNDGVERRVMAIPIPNSAARPMDAGKFVSVTIQMIGFDITVEITDSQTGAPYPLGRLTDPEHSFPVGAVGIATHNDEENVIERFVVCTGEKCFNE